MAARLGVAFAGSECSECYGYAKPFIYLQQPCIVSQSTSICACQKSLVLIIRQARSRRCIAIYIPWKISGKADKFWALHCFT